MMMVSIVIATATIDVEMGMLNITLRVRAKYIDQMTELYWTN